MNERVWSFRRGFGKGSWRLGGQREADLENSLYLFVIHNEYENRPQFHTDGFRSR